MIKVISFHLNILGDFQDKIYTFDEDRNCISAVKDNPEISLAYKIKYG